MSHTTRTRWTRLSLTLAGAAMVAPLVGLSSAAAGQPQVIRADVLRPGDVRTALGVNHLTADVGRGDGDYGISACTGEDRMADIVGSDAVQFHGVFTGKRFDVVEHVAGLRSVSANNTAYRKIVKDVSACQHEPAGHFRYGPTHVLKTEFGTAKWMTTTSGDGKQSGGVLVAKSGRHLAVVESLVGSGAAIKRLAAQTLLRVS